MTCIIRRTTEDDANQIDDLVRQCFGIDYSRKHLYKLKDRYLVAEHKETHEIVAMTGICLCKPGEFDDHTTDLLGYVVDWTCCDEKYRGYGIVTRLLRQCLSEVDDKYPVYCSCWAGGNKTGNDEIHLRFAMKELGFREYIHAHKVYRNTSHQKCKFCAIEDKNTECNCREDLYIYDKNIESNSFII